MDAGGAELASGSGLPTHGFARRLSLAVRPDGSAALFFVAESSGDAALEGVPLCLP